MSSKTLTIKLGYDSVYVNYHVLQITDSVDYHPGQVLSKSEVKQLCSSRVWKVTIVDWRGAAS